jgi:hypothetical protein
MDAVTDLATTGLPTMDTATKQYDVTRAVWKICRCWAGEGVPSAAAPPALGMMKDLSNPRGSHRLI